jgi:hypothetical protein
MRALPQVFSLIEFISAMASVSFSRSSSLAVSAAVTVCTSPSKIARASSTFAARLLALPAEPG